MDATESLKSGFDGLVSIRGRKPVSTFRNRLLIASVLVCAVCGLAQQASHHSETAIHGWLSDERCARGRAEGGTFTATNPRCAKECVAQGRKIVLIDPNRKMIFTIANQSIARTNVGDYVRVAGEIDLQAGTVRIASLKLLARGTAGCERPKLSN
jgi:hypothetical protein